MRQGYRPLVEAGALFLSETVTMLRGRNSTRSWPASFYVWYILLSRVYTGHEGHGWIYRWSCASKLWNSLAQTSFGFGQSDRQIRCRILPTSYTCTKRNSINHPHLWSSCPSLEGCCFYPSHIVLIVPLKSKLAKSYFWRAVTWAKPEYSVSS